MDEHYVKWCVVLFFPLSPPDDDRRRRRYHSGWLLVGNIIAEDGIFPRRCGEEKRNKNREGFFIFRMRSYGKWIIAVETEQEEEEEEEEEGLRHCTRYLY